MQASIYVYSGIFGLAFLPLLYLLLREVQRLRKHPGKKGWPRVILLATAVVLLPVLMWGMYIYTQDTQPLLVAEREARAVLAEEDTSAWEGCSLQMPKQSQQEGDTRIYLVMLENDADEKLVAQVILSHTEASEHPQVVETSILRGDEADEAVGHGLYFDVGPLE